MSNNTARESQVFRFYNKPFERFARYKLKVGKGELEVIPDTGLINQLAFVTVITKLI